MPSLPGVPGVHEFTTFPFTHELDPVELHIPVPQLVDELTKSLPHAKVSDTVIVHVNSAAPVPSETVIFKEWVPDAW